MTVLAIAPISVSFGVDIQQPIEEALLGIMPFHDWQVRLFLEKVTVQSFRKNECLLSPPKVCRWAAIVLKGSFRMFRKTEEKEHTLHFFTEKDWIGDLESFVSQQPSQNYIQAMEKSEVGLITIHALHELMAVDQMFMGLGRMMKGWTITTNQYTSLIDDNPDARYQALLKDHPEWILRFPQMHLAAYLGMSRETFSRVKRRNAALRAGIQ
jgi:CRP-like cAMP-binding protein